ncbi:response regulator transcription factor [Bradyrhizobium amphicarpaeae]|uniref:DNA-binding response regulator n=1 Tax=Bradyrhizobium amphicarpaeae TaxID=1404768 RepID=A0A2U8PQ00_9BRAD|nr:response regulator [Bradyrhizobium amphicarpaeae]AWL99710.1 DNA-binding response regulator [Bradyrhizobium amphicarpaeae]
MAENEIFILEDDLTTRAMLRVVLEKAGYQPVFFADGEALVAKSRHASPACILLDLCLPGISGLDVLGQLTDRTCPAPILMVSGQGDIPTAVRALRIGAADFVEKPFSPADLVARIESAGAGQPAHSANPLDHFKQSRGLTRRECEVLDHLIAGSSSKVIARKLGISPRTIEDHRARILQKAGVKTTAQLSIMAFKGPQALKDLPAAFGRRTVH